MRLPSRVVSPKLLALVLAFAVVAAPVAAAPRASRVETQPYTGPAYGASVSTPLPTSTLAGYCDPSISVPPSKGCVRFAVRKGDRFLSLRIDDRAGLPVLGQAVDSLGRVLQVFCGETTDPLVLPSDAAHVDVWVVAGNCPEVGQPSAPTVGSITATFTRRK